MYFINPCKLPSVDLPLCTGNIDIYSVKTFELRISAVHHAFWPLLSSGPFGF